jgi:phosphoenolpyruvate carboxykinase (ATP)
VQQLFGGSQPEHRVGVQCGHRVRLAQPVHPDACWCRPTLPRSCAGFDAEYTIIDLPSFRADPAKHGTRTETVVAVNLTEKLVLIGGTAYAGEMKKSCSACSTICCP